MVQKILKIVKTTEDSLSEQISEVRKNPIIKKLSEKTNINVDELVPTGATVFNLECSGRVEGAFRIGRLVNLIGDSHSGKSLLSFTIFAECNKLERFNDYKFIYDDVEAANSFNLPVLFGNECASRIDQTYRSRTIENFCDKVAHLLDDDIPFIYVLDSFDALTSEAALEKDEENRKKRDKGNETKGEYTDGKAKLFSKFCSMRIQELAEKDSVLIVISQTRDNIGFGAMFTPKTRSGGNALRFYSALEVWLACQKKDKEGKRTIRTNVQAKITKNKLIGKQGEAMFSVLNDYGVDNIRSCIRFLVEEGEWSGSPGAINTQGFMEPSITKSTGKAKHPSMEDIIQYIEQNNKEKELDLLCQKTYNNIMIKIKPNRKPKYVN